MPLPAETPETALLVSDSNNNGLPSLSIDERRLNALIDRLDRIAQCTERSTTKIHRRTLMTLDICSPAPIGYMSFAVGLSFYMTVQAHLVEQASQFITFVSSMFVGGLIMMVAGFFELFRKNALGAVSLATYGSFFISVGVYGTIRASGVFFLDAPHGEQALTVIMGFASLCFFIISFQINLALPIMFFNLMVMFFLLAGGMVNTTCARVAGWWGIMTSGCAYYGAIAELFREQWGIDILPQFFTKKYNLEEKLWFPRANVRVKSGDIEDGGLLKKYNYMD